jgi:hypothetical protein
MDRTSCGILGTKQTEKMDNILPILANFVHCPAK